MSNSSREDSPDWLRSFQTPTKSVLTLSSSESPSDNSHFSEDEKDNEQNGESPLNISTKKSPGEKPKAELLTEKKRKRDNHSKREGKMGDKKFVKQEKSEDTETHEPKHSVWMLLSDSESCPETSPLREDNHKNTELSTQKKAQFSDSEKDNVTVHEDTLQEAPPRKSPRRRKTENQIPIKKKKANSQVKGGNDGDLEASEEDISGKPAVPCASSSRLPLVLSEKVQRSKALVECEGESIDLSGDMGAVGRVIISDNLSRGHDMFIDLKGTIYKTAIIPSRTFCVVNFGQTEAKIEAIMNDFIQLKPQSNVYEAETMVEGTLDGFSFDSEDEADNLPKTTTNQTDQNQGAEEKSNGKGRGKAEKKPVVARKKGKAAGGGKPPKKVKKKTQVAKKTKAKK